MFLTFRIAPLRASFSKFMVLFLLLLFITSLLLFQFNKWELSIGMYENNVTEYFNKQSSPCDVQVLVCSVAISDTLNIQALTISKILKSNFNLVLVKYNVFSILSNSRWNVNMFMLHIQILNDQPNCASFPHTIRRPRSFDIDVKLFTVWSISRYQALELLDGHHDVVGYIKFSKVFLSAKMLIAFLYSFREGFIFLCRLQSSCASGYWLLLTNCRNLLYV